MNLPKIEQQVCTFEQSVKISAMGLNLESYFYWVDYPLGSGKSPRLVPSVFNPPKKYPALTVSELGVLLGIHIGFSHFEIGPCDPENGNFVLIIYGDGEDDIRYFETEAQARAEAYIWLRDKGYLDKPKPTPPNPRSTIMDDTPTR